MKKILMICISGFILLSIVITLWGVTPIDEKHYILLATTRTSTMEKELSEAASQGYRVKMGAPTSGDEMVILMEKLSNDSQTFQYKLLATTRTGTMDKELNEAGDSGFRILPQTMVAKRSTFGGFEVVVILEKLKESSSRYQYKLLATSRTSTMGKEISEAEGAGFALVGICSRGEHIAIMEKELK